MVYPLITKADGTKFGKTESGSIWLSPQRTSPYRFYQFWLNTADKDVIPYLKYFTWRTQAEIAGLETALAERPEQREAQRVLARDMTALVHDSHGLSQGRTGCPGPFWRRDQRPVRGRDRRYFRRGTLQRNARASRFRRQPQRA